MATTVDDKKIIYSMSRVSRTYGTKTVLKDISISYYYGAKIGVIGANGSGKSSLFKILAGVDTEFTGETAVSPGYSIGYLEQEPELEAGKTVKEIVSEGVKEVTDLLAEFDRINEAFGDPDADIEKLCDQQAAVQEKLDAMDAWNLDSRLELAMDALRCPPPDQCVDVLSVVSVAVWLCADFCCKSPTSSCWTSPPTTWTQKLLPGLSATCSSTKELLSPLPTTVTSWTI